MAKLINKMLNLVGWESEDEFEQEQEEEMVEEYEKPQFTQYSIKRQQNKVVNIHSASQVKVVIMQPETFDDAQDVSNHLKDKKPIIVNLEFLEKELAQRIVDFLSGSVYALDGNIQKISNGIFLVAPHNVDIMGDFNDELKNKGVFPWIK